MGLALVYINERDEVLVEPISSELEVVKWSTQKVETTSAVEVLETQRILKWREREHYRCTKKCKEREGVTYLSPDLALKQSVDLLILAFFIESKPLQPNGDGEKDQINKLRCIPAYLSWLSTLNPDIAMCSHLPHCLLAGPWYLSGTSRGPSWRY